MTARRIAGAALSLLPLLAAAAPHGLTARDLVGLARVTEPALSPDGSRLVYTLRETDLAADRGRTDLWLVDLDGAAEPRRLTSHEENDAAADWAADGSGVYFLSARGGSTQVWFMPAGGGEATAVTRLPLDVASFRASPRGDRLVLALEVFPDCRDLACTRKRLDDAAASKARGQAHDGLFVRHWDRWKDGRVAQLFSVALDRERRPRGEPVPLTAALDADVPPKPNGGRADFAISPDGTQVVFSARLRGKLEPASTNFDVWRVPADGSGAPQNLTGDNPAWDAQPAFSPDGRLVAHLAMDRPGFEADRFRLVLRDAATGAVRSTVRDWDRSIAAFRFAPGGREILATADDVGQRPLFAIDIASHARRKLTGPGHVAEFDAAGGGIVFALQSLTSPAELYLLRDAAPARPLTRANEARLAQVRFGEAEQFAFEGAGGERVHAWAIKPWDWRPGARYPLALVVHGGPQSSMANTWSYRWNPQVLAGAGYAVLLVEFHGSTGYGQAFTDSISRDWGGKPLEDLRKGVAAAADRFPWIDAGRACALGASYGGYMVNWIAGNWPDGFRCLVNHAGLFDIRSMYYTTEELWFPEWDHGGPYYEDPESHERHNPARFVQAWKTPMLVIHGALDYRVPYAQGLATFTALQRRGIESRFLYFPDENHWILKPANSLQWHAEVLGWLDRHLK